VCICYGCELGVEGFQKEGGLDESEDLREDFRPEAGDWVLLRGSLLGLELLSLFPFLTVPTPTSQVEEDWKQDSSLYQGLSWIT
jgi:hypothetical protein